MLIGIGVVPLHVQLRYYLSLILEIAMLDSLIRERDIIISENKKLKSENEQLRIQLLTMPIKEKGTVGVTHLHCHLLVNIFCTNS